jgi:hypothetical protein
MKCRRQDRVLNPVTAALVSGHSPTQEPGPRFSIASTKRSTGSANGHGATLPVSRQSYPTRLSPDQAVDVVGYAIDLKGPYIQGPPGGRFIYLSWGTVDGDSFTLFRRAKLWFDAIPPHVMLEAVDLGVLLGRHGLTDRKGNPLCAAVRPPTIEWRATAD